MSPEAPRLSLATVCLSGTLEDKLAAAATAGFDGVEIFAPDLVADALSPTEIGARCRDLGLSVDLYQPLRDVDSCDPDRFTANLRRAEATFDVMAGLGADTVLLCSSVAPDAVADRDLLAAQLRTLAERAHVRGMRIAYEALAWGRHVNTWDASWETVRAADHPALGLCLDSFHVLARGSDPAPIADVPGDRLFFLQLADARELSMDVLSWSRHHRLFPGQGGFDLPGFLGPVLAAGYAGPLSLEVFNDVFRQADPVRTAADAHRSLLALAEATESPPAAVTPPAPTGPAFVELRQPSDGDPDGTDLGETLRALGFTRTGVHRTKPVERYEQGDARLLVGTAPGRDTGGTSIAAIGVECPDPPASARRAVRLGAPRLPRLVGPDEADMTEVVAPDGTSLLFCRTTADGPGPVWTHDFVDTREPAAPGVGITGIDHIGLTQPYDAFDEAVLFHRAVLGLGAIADGEFAAPFGLVRSRALADADRRTRIALTVSLLRRGEWSPAVADPQYVALACDDVLATATAARRAGVRLLDVPANYHDDLAARMALPDGRITTYRELGVLHERDADGDLLQVCTELLDGRVFLSIVQRTGRHDGHGWVDAPVRMAAHRRARAVAAS